MINGNNEDVKWTKENGWQKILSCRTSILKLKT